VKSPFTLGRIALRGTWFLAASFAGLLHAAWLALFERDVPPATRRARWLRRWGSELIRIAGVQVEVRGHPPDGGLLVANHVSYLDVAALASATEMVFVSKAEVRHWPLIGQLARAGGTLFLQRERRADVADLAPQFQPLVEEGVVLTLFPEGTSTGGDHVLPFHSALLAPAARHGWPVTPAHVRYELPGGSVADEVAYWRDMTFLPHFLNLLGRRGGRVVVQFGEPQRDSDRKALARSLHAAVVALSQRSTQVPAQAQQPTA
jgi:1-acyl-sn-glycerol-3-phosphate acyltransferase